jgi:hypothetical protein
LVFYPREPDDEPVTIRALEAKILDGPTMGSQEAKYDTGLPRYVEWIKAWRLSEPASLAPFQAFSFGIGNGHRTNTVTFSPARLSTLEAVAGVLRTAKRRGTPGPEALLRLADYDSVWKRAIGGGGNSFINTRGGYGYDSNLAQVLFEFEGMGSTEGVYSSIIAVLAFFYGGVHLAAWQSDFPTNIEAWMWRGASISLMAILPLMWICVALASSLPKTDSAGAKRLFDFLLVVLIIIVVVLFLLFIAARMFLIVESFISLRAVPIGVYWTPAWVQMIPHL